MDKAYNVYIVSASMLLCNIVKIFDFLFHQKNIADGKFLNLFLCFYIFLCVFHHIYTEVNDLHASRDHQTSLILLKNLSVFA